MISRLRSSAPPLAVYLAAMAAAILLPFILFVGLLLFQLEKREHRALERRAADAAQTISAAVERHLRDMATTLKLLSSSPELSSGDLRAFHNRTRAALIASPWFVLAVDRDGRQLLNTRVPFGTPLGRTSDPESLVDALDRGHIDVSSVFFGRTSEKWVFNVIQPLQQRTDGGVAALIITQNAEALSSVIAVGSMPADWSSALVDQNGQLIAASGAYSEAKPGTPFLADLHSPRTSGPGSIEFTANGVANLAGHASLRGWSWHSFVWGPVRSAQASVLTSWQSLIIGGVMLSLLSAVFVVLLAVRLRRAIRSLTGVATKLGAGDVVPPARTGIRETDRVAVALTEASFDRTQSEERTHFVLRELVHRTKNLLTVVQSMLRQTARQAGSLEEFLPAAGERLNGLARSIDLLTDSDWTGVSLCELVRAQVGTFVAETERVVITGDAFLLKPDAVQNLGMAFHELGTNATKYGSLSVPNGKIEVRWHFSDNGETEQINIEWKETGGPLVEQSDRRGFGTTVLELHATASLRGKVELSMERDGLRWSVVTDRENLEWKPVGEVLPTDNGK